LALFEQKLGELARDIDIELPPRGGSFAICLADFDD
jgi:hypothetical protein